MSKQFWALHFTDDVEDEYCMAVSDNKEDLVNLPLGKMSSADRGCSWDYSAEVYTGEVTAHANYDYAPDTGESYTHRWQIRKYNLGELL